jgi:hypothetical protein
VVVILKLSLDLFTQREGMDLEPPVLDIKECDYNVNVIFPYLDVKNNLYTDKNNYLYHNYQNILTHANNPCNPKK